MDRFMEFWEEANKVISKVPFTENSHREVIRLQGLALGELEEMERKPQLESLEVKVPA